MQGLYAMPFLDNGTGQNSLVAMCQSGFTSFDFSGTGSLTVELFFANAMGQRPASYASRTMSLSTATTSDDFSRLWIDFKDSPKARFWQLQFSATGATAMTLIDYALQFEVHKEN